MKCTLINTRTQATLALGARWNGWGAFLSSSERNTLGEGVFPVIHSRNQHQHLSFSRAQSPRTSCASCGASASGTTAGRRRPRSQRIDKTDKRDKIVGFKVPLIWVSRRYTTRDATQFRDAWAPHTHTPKGTVYGDDYLVYLSQRQSDTHPGSTPASERQTSVQ